MSHASWQVSSVVREGRSCAAGICRALDCAVDVVDPGHRSSCRMLRNMLACYAAIAIVGHGGVLITSTAFYTRILTHLCNLITRVVSVYARGVDAAALPVEYFGLNGATESV